MIGKLIVFEGLNGSGKSTIIHKIKNELPNELYKVIKFPNRDSETGKIIDSFLKNKIELTLQECQDVFINNIIESQVLITNTLNSGVNIICDRYVTSTLSYQYTELINNMITTSHKNKENILTLISTIKNLPKPDIVFLINGDHIDNRNDSICQRYHKNETINWLVINNYITVLTLLNDNWEIIDNTNYTDITTKMNVDIILNYIYLLKKNINIITY